jgi:diadenosine tetraphosphatase ApaH/serine/threonine PP2A family protein phosphatase
MMMRDPETEAERYDIVGDVHGCGPELDELLGALGYSIEDDVLRHPDARRFVFLGDLVDRGPDTVGVLRLAMGSVAAGTALCVVGNHDDKFRRALLGHPVKIKRGLAETLEQVGREGDRFRKEAMAFIEGLPDHLVLDSGRLVVAHAGLPEALHGTSSRRVRDFAMYGLTTGRLDAQGLPERLDWAADYSGQAVVVYGHTPVVEPVWVNRTIDIDTGCVYGHRLTALRYPERELVSVAARRVYVEKSGPFRVVGPGGAAATFDPRSGEGANPDL